MKKQKPKSKPYEIILSEMETLIKIMAHNKTNFSHPILNKGENKLSYDIIDNPDFRRTNEQEFDNILNELRESLNEMEEKQEDVEGLKQTIERYEEENRKIGDLITISDFINVSKYKYFDSCKVAIYADNLKDEYILLDFLNSLNK
jgi:hypothetical protein